MTPLHLAARKGHTETVLLLLMKPGTDSAPRDKLRNLPSDHAISKAHDEIADIFGLPWGAFSLRRGELFCVKGLKEDEDGYPLVDTTSIGSLNLPK